MMDLRSLFLGLPLVLAGCGGEPLILLVPNPVVVMPDNEFFECPVVDDFPDPSMLTDGQIAALLVELDTNNRTCADSLVAVKNELLEAAAKLEKESD